MQIIQRQLTGDEAQLLHECIKQTPNITGYTLKELLDFKDVFIACENGKFMGTCISKDLLGSWSEIAILYVLETERGNGAGRNLFTHAYDALVQRGRHVYVVTRNPIVLHLMQERRMSIVASIIKLPALLHASNFFYLLSWYRMKEYVRKDFRKGLPGFVYGYMKTGSGNR